MGYWSLGDAVNPRQVAQQLSAEVQYRSMFAYITGENYREVMSDKFGVRKSPYNSKTMTPTGAIIEEYTDLKSHGTNLDIPVITPLKTGPLAGDTESEGKGEKSHPNYRKVAVNAMRKPQKLNNDLDEQIAGKALVRQVDQARQMLGDWYVNYTDGSHYFTMCHGVGPTLTTLSGIQGASSESTFSHPNFYTYKGQVAYGANRPGTSGYEAAVVAALNDFDGIDSKEVLTPEILDQLVVEAQLKKIAPFETGDGAYYIFLTHTKGANQVRTSKTYRESMNYAGMGAGYKSPIFRPNMTVWNNVIVMESPKAWGVQMSDWGSVSTVGTNGAPAYGPSGWLDDVTQADINQIKLGFLLGASSMTKAGGVTPLEFNGQEKDFGKRKEVELYEIFGHVRSDIFDTDGKNGLTAGSFKENPYSLVYAYSAPTNSGWGG